MPSNKSEKKMVVATPIILPKKVISKSEARRLAVQAPGMVVTIKKAPQPNGYSRLKERFEALKLTADGRSNTITHLNERITTQQGHIKRVTKMLGRTERSLRTWKNLSYILVLFLIIDTFIVIFSK